MGRPERTGLDGGRGGPQHRNGQSSLPGCPGAGDSYDNALAETVNGLYKAELSSAASPWRTLEQVEAATARWVHWWNTGRLQEAYHARISEAAEAA